MSMLYWNEYKGHNPDIRGKRKRFDNTIYTFDIETSSYLLLNDEIIKASDYEYLSKKEQEQTIKQSNMYIWMFGINNQVYYGRTWDEFKLFLNKLYECVPELKIIFIHNLAFEFQYLKTVLNIDSIMARAVHKPMKAGCSEYNIEFRCTYMMSNCALAKLPKLFKLPVEKKVGDLDYSLIRHSKTPLTETELGYCEYDCLVVYEYIKYELKTYEDVNKLPTTSTGHVRGELKDLTRTNYVYKKQVRKSVNTDPHIYNLLVKGFAGGYTHANYRYTDTVVENVDSWDFTSSYPYCMVVEKFPATKFKPISFTKYEELMPDLFAYLMVVRFTNVRSKFWNNFISKSKCFNYSNVKEDNGRIISAKELTTIITEIDLKIILDSYNCDYEILECYYSVKKYLPKELVNFILDKYVLKTKYKGDPEYDLEYAKQKALFNSIFGMSVTNEIRDEVDFKNDEWLEIPLDNSEIEKRLLKQEKDGFLSFSYGIYVTSYARRNLLENVMKLDDYAVYMDTDSIKVTSGYDIKVIEEYNEKVLNKLKRASKDLNIPLEKFMPEDIKGVKHPLGVFDSDGHYKKFITQGAKKYAYETDDGLHITVSGVPKSGVACLNGNIENFRDDLVFEHKYTNKNLLMYSEEQKEVILKDYLGEELKVSDRSGCCILPTTYILGKSNDYIHLLSEDSSKRAIYSE